MKITLCNITKGDEELTKLKRMIASVADFVDYVCITTNGEHKKTEKWLKEQGYNHSHLDWNDNFSEQRNFNFSQAPKDTDMIIWLDTDDVLVGSEYLREVVKIAMQKNEDTVYLTYWYGCNFAGVPNVRTLKEVEVHHPRERIIKPGRITWKKRIHETPVENPGIKYTYSRLHHLPTKPHKVFPIAVLHLGADRNIDDESMAERNQRNRRLLELELQDERDAGKPDPRTMIYLQKILAESDIAEDLKEGINLGQEYLQMSGWDEERAICLRGMARCYGKLGDDTKAVSLLMQATHEWPHDPMTYLMIAEGYYNLGLYGKMTHWLDFALSLDPKESTAAMSNIYQMKVLAAELMLKRFMQADKDVEKALEAAKMLNKENPTPNNQHNVDYLEDLVKLNDACRNVDELVSFLGQNDHTDAVISILENLPEQIKQRPFTGKLWNRYAPPRIWGEKEIAYLANFGGPAIYKWDAGSLNEGIGGSETAVIELSREWAKKGYTVVVYGDPRKPGIVEELGEGKVIYEPYWKFNRKDKFNIFIQWRGNSLAGLVSAKKFLVDLHDVWGESDYTNRLQAIDKIMVKSDFHKSFGKSLPDEKFKVVSNGINV